MGHPSQLGGPPRLVELRDRLRQFLVVPYDDAMAWEWATISTIKGHPISSSDAWIAAAARRHDIPLATHSGKHYRHIPSLTLISES